MKFVIGVIFVAVLISSVALAEWSPEAVAEYDPIVKKIFSALENGQYASLYDLYSAEAKKKISLEKVMAKFEKIGRTFGRYKSSEITGATFYPNSTFLTYRAVFSKDEDVKVFFSFDPKDKKIQDVSIHHNY